MTATARADIGASRARRKAWVRGCVQICDDTCSSSGDLDWEFALHSCPGHSAGMEVAMAKQSHRRCDQLPVLHPDAAGIDVGASELFVAVGADRDPQPVRRFPTFTRDLHALADWLEQCGVRSVAMESTVFTGFRSIRFWRLAASRSARTKDGCIRLPVASVPALRRFAASQLPSAGHDLRRACSLAASRQPGPDGG